MKTPTFRLVGVRANGARIVIHRSDLRETAERDLRLIRYAADFREFVIELDDRMSSLAPRRPRLFRGAKGDNKRQPIF